MQDQKTIQTYINNFRRNVAPFLGPGIRLSCEVHPAFQDGAILQFLIGPDVSNVDQYFEPTDTVNSALRNVPQRMVGGDPNAIRFSGTSISMKANRIILIKGEDSLDLWDDKGAQADVRHIVDVHMRGQK